MTVQEELAGSRRFLNGMGLKADIETQTTLYKDKALKSPPEIYSMLMSIHNLLSIVVLLYQDSSKEKEALECTEALICLNKAMDNIVDMKYRIEQANA